MEKSNLSAPSFWLSPSVRKKINLGRLYTDIIGLGMIYTLGSLTPSSFQWITELYTIIAWVTILTIDPARLPDASTTKMKQLKAWWYLGLMLPIYSVAFGILLFQRPIHINSISVAEGISLLTNAIMIELYFRNILQAKLCQLGLPKLVSICLQSIVFATHFYFINYSFLITSGAFIVGTINGIVVYKTRSIYPSFLITILWVFLFSK